MCLIKKHKFPKIAFKSIKVYKILYNYNNCLYSPYFGCKVINKKIKAKYFKIPEIVWEEDINGCGVHAFSTLKEAMQVKENLEIFHQNPLMKIYECIIPPFTLYWNGKGGDIAARRINIKKEILNDL